ncbi:hypothetical protein DKZ56_08915 [Ureibacillus thermophilus]|uniref:Uncharacterized protein n=1 Tax=Ureibacillus thermophilus TaxID=367743 RepID=A0A4V1A345_9BACL|nr:hypothetical protein DKZ56_08915 [Ureibacillus thermophilus]
MEVSALIGGVNARNGAVSARNEEVNARNGAVSARNEEVNARNFIKFSKESNDCTPNEESLLS